MTHLTMDQLVALRDGSSEPGTAAAREHLESCAQCAAELDRLHQRIARLRALPNLRPSRDLWPQIDAERRRLRRGRRTRWMGIGGLALAASLAGVAAIGPGMERSDPAGAELPVEGELAAVRERSQALETMLDAYNPDARVIDGQTARVAQALEDRIADVDHELQVTELQREAPDQDEVLLDLWRERVGLLDALVDVHVTRASNVGL
ncbi:MAG TPA: hypothetical protein VFZ13_04340 [Gemmatimonadales bacterium]